MSKNVVITICIVFLLIVGVFFFFSSSSCKRESETTNIYSFTHLTLTVPPEATDFDWSELKDVYEARIYDFADMRIFQVQEGGRKAIVEITGAHDPDMIASLLITPLNIVIKEKGADSPIAESEEIEAVRSIYFDDQMESLGLYVGLSSEAGTKLSAYTANATPDNPLTLTMFVDGKEFSEMVIPIPIQDNALQFEIPEGIDDYTTDLLSFMFSKKLPFTVGLVMEQSYLIPPKGTTPAELQIKDVIGDLLKK